MSFASLLVNFMFAKGDKQRDAGLTTPDDVIRYDNISTVICDDLDWRFPGRSAALHCKCI